MAIVYGVEDGDLVVSDRRGSHIRMRPGGRRVEKALAIPASSDAIVLLRWWGDDVPRSFANLVRVRPDGSACWSATPPTDETGADDAWVAFRWGARGGLSANSWSGFHCAIDADTGAIQAAVFTK